MVNVTCCGNQDRATEASETHPNRPPNDTRNCYTRGNDSQAPFDWNQCGLNDRACAGVGNCDACIPDSSGGYCQDEDGNINVARGSNFITLTGREIIDRLRTRGDGRRTDLRVRRRERDLERKMENRIREMQIMGRDPFPTRQILTTVAPPTSQSFVGSYINIIMLGLGILLLTSSFVLEYAKKHKLLK
tara:strand:+ start:1071 stop:1637 length:567 start_codon:yes stop_codon:yes gene_type:complete